MTGMVLADGVIKISAPIELPVGETVRRAGCEWSRWRVKRLEVKPLVGEIGKDDGAVGNGVIATAVLVHAGAGVESRWRDINDFPGGGAPHDYLTAAFLGAPLDPIDVMAVDADLFQADLATADYFGSDRRFPRTKGGNDRCHKMFRAVFVCITQQVIVFRGLKLTSSARQVDSWRYCLVSACCCFVSHAFILDSNRSNGMAPSLSTSSWKWRMSNLSPRVCFALARSSEIFS